MPDELQFAWEQPARLPIDERTEEELIIDFKNYLCEIVDELEEECNIHKWHVIDIPKGRFPRGIVIPADSQMYMGEEINAARKLFGGKYVIQFMGFNFILR